MKTPQRYTLDNLLDMAVTKARVSVKTQYACEVIRVSEDGRFVDLVHNTLEWTACCNGDVVLRNSYGKDVLCSASTPWVVTDIPVEQPYVRGQWKIKARPRVGDKGILSVFYHDIGSLKNKGGFQSPDAIRVMAIDSASWRPGLPNHADVNAETDSYPSDDEWEIKGNGVKVKFTSPVDADSQSPNKMEINVGSVSFTVTVPQSGDPTVVFNAPNGAVTVNAKTANVTLSESATITTPTTTVKGDVTITGALSVSSTITGAGITDSAGNVKLGTHTHGVPPSTPTPTPGS